MSWPRAILHVDMDAFFASVEQLDHPEIRGKPVLVGYDGPRGVVAAASYEARRFGCHSAQPMAVAKRNCPHAVIMPGRFHRYRETSEQVFEIFERFSPVVEPLSVDEAFLDVTGTGRLLGPPEQIAKDIRERIKAEVKLTASVGVAPNKFLAKLASDMNKPDGLTVIRSEDVDTVLPPLSLGKIWGIGPKSAERLATLGLKTIGDLRKMSPDWFADRFGIDGERLLNLCHGRDERDVTPDREAKSIGQEQTFGEDVADAEHVRHVLLGQVEQVSRRLRKHGLMAHGIGLKIRFGDFKTISRSATLPEASDSTKTLWEASLGVFNEWAASGYQPVRLIGMHAARLVPAQSGQMSLFPDPQADRQRKLDQTLDRINARFGKTTVRRAASED